MTEFRRACEALARRIERDFEEVPAPTDWIWDQPVAVRVIDCVLSLNRKYETVVLPRVRTFRLRRPDVVSLADLAAAIHNYVERGAFLRVELNLNDPARDDVLRGVLEYLIDQVGRFSGDTEEERLRQWATFVRPGDHAMVMVRGFGLAGFQYLRMLMGAETVKPDVHVIQYVKDAVGHDLTAEQVLCLVEEVAKDRGIPGRNLDVAMWRRGSGAEAVAKE